METATASFWLFSRCMAEGHAVARWGDTLRALIGERVVDIAVPARWREAAAHVRNARLTRVQTHGKHLVLHFSSEWVIHTHAMQYGSWQVGPIGQTLRKDARHARLRFTTDAHDVVFYHGPVMEVLPLDDLSRHHRFSSLGPDLLHDDFLPDAIRASLRAQGEREIGDAILDQRLVAGIGNIYKSEGLFLACIHPRRRCDSIGSRELDVFFQELIPLMQSGRSARGMTITLPDDLRFEPWMRTWVYRRRGHPCFVCATGIQMIRQGIFARTTYFCPHCQPEDARR